MKKTFHYILTVAMMVGLMQVSAQGAENNSITIGIGGADVKDNTGLYQEQTWSSGDFQGGIEDLNLYGDGFALEGFHAMGDEGDYGMDLTVDLSDSSELRIKSSHFRKYFSDTGGYYEGFDPSSYSLDKELHLDIGSFLIELELNDEDSPWSLVMGYELKYKDGTKSLLEWNSISQSGTRKYIYPSTKDIEEMTHVVSADVRYETDTILVEDRLSYEVYDSDTSRSDLVPAALAGRAEDQGHPVRDDDSKHGMLANDIRVEKWTSEQTMLSAGYIVLNMNGDAKFAMAYTPANGVYSSHAKFYEIDSIDLDRVSHVFNANVLHIPSEDWTLTAGLQAEISKDEVTAHNNLKHGNPASASFDHLVEVESEIDALIFSELLEARYTGIEGMTWYANAKLVQDSNELKELMVDHDGAQELNRDTDALNLNSKARLGVTATPSSRATLGFYYQYANIDNDYDHKIDEESAIGVEAEGYSGNIQALKSDTHEAVAKLNYRICSNVRTSLKYQFVSTVGEQTSAPKVGGGGGTQDNYEYDANIVSLSTTIVPSAKSHLTAVLQYRDTLSKIPELASVTTLSDHTADALVVILNSFVMLSDATDLSLNYVYTMADNDQENPKGLPVVAKFDKHSMAATVDHDISETLGCKLTYAVDIFSNDHYINDEADYTAHGLYASVTKVF